MPCCCVSSCSNRSEKGFRLFHLPKGKANEERRKLWVQNIGRKNLPNNPFVCEIHFTEDQFERNRADGKVLLKWNAVPTVFTNCKLSPEVAAIISQGIASNEIQEGGDVLQKILQTTQPGKSKRRGLEGKSRKLRRMHKEASTTFSSTGEESVQELDNENKETTEVVKGKCKSKPKKMRKTCKDSTPVENMETVYIKIPENVDNEYDEKTELITRLNIAENKISELENNLFAYQNILGHLFNSDQITYLMSEPVRGFKWSDETINNALMLYESCGRFGYEELRKQNFPFPCVHTLEAVLNKFEMQP